jgi:hypothetical protein
MRISSDKPRACPGNAHAEGMTEKSQKPGNKGARHHVDITALIRSVQLAEGNLDCFRRESVHCDRNDCAWRRYCLEPVQKREDESGT